MIGWVVDGDDGDVDVVIFVVGEAVMETVVAMVVDIVVENVVLMVGEAVSRFSRAMIS